LNYFRFASITLGPGQTLTGAGPSTVFDMTGDGHAGTWYGIQVNGGSVRAISMNQTGLVNPDPDGQVHMIQVGAGDSSVISDVTLGSSSSGLGDSIRLLGTDSSNVQPDHASPDLERHGASVRPQRARVQHDVASATIAGSVWNSIADQDIDYEPDLVIAGERRSRPREQRGIRQQHDHRRSDREHDDRRRDPQLDGSPDQRELHRPAAYCARRLRRQVQPEQRWVSEQRDHRQQPPRPEHPGRGDPTSSVYPGRSSRRTT